MAVVNDDYAAYVQTARGEIPIRDEATNAEVSDIRLGFDGTTYESAGEAVRGQTGKIHDNIIELSKNAITNLTPKSLFLTGIKNGSDIIKNEDGSVTVTSTSVYGSYMVTFETPDKTPAPDDLLIVIKFKIEDLGGNDTVNMGVSVAPFSPENEALDVYKNIDGKDIIVNNSGEYIGVYHSVY